ncbi:hypothetical protein [Aquimarina sp. MMG016]|uniref:hypothetical protein n=1 Tax=Aquimarina sp. MMG016 TaxID=2822690 RepID=UPI001B3A3570|nr:hypothetical protein [Aquimarina sp. MMG016]MBQ4822206.1 hypothetical protein [Aquimarina sp. MMG016]
MVGKNTFDDIYYQWNLNQYDLNQDGFFTGDEVTEEFRIALKLLTQDTSRNFSFITGAIFSLLVSTPIYFMSLIIEKVKSSNYIHCNPKNFNI